MKVAAYCRVSTDREDQANSFESQQRYFREYIAGQPDWELYEVYADEGVTGTSTRNRRAFHRMMEDARRGCFSLILTKEVSRFSRNILDTIAYTRELRRLGVGVCFLNDGIHTLDPDAELRLSIMGSLAQEESRRISQRVKWGQTRRMEQGVVFGRSLLGYDVRDGKLHINPQGAEIVRQIFFKYVHERKGTTVIARELREAGYKTFGGSTAWRNTAVLKVLRNEKYCGDLRQKKTITPDYLTHRKQYNHGQEPFVFLQDHHEPIISRQLWLQAQRELDRRDVDGRLGAGHGNRYPLSGKIKCGLCGASFVSRCRRRRDGSCSRVWRCGTATAEGRRHTDPAGNQVGCDIGYQIRDELGLELVRRSLEKLELDVAPVVRDLTRLVLEVLDDNRAEKWAEEETILRRRERLKEKKRKLLDAFLGEQISREDMELMNGDYDRQLAELEEKLTAWEQESGAMEDTLELTRQLEARVTGIVSGTTAPDSFYGGLLEQITACPGQQLEVRLRCLPTRWIYTLEK